VNVVQYLLLGLGGGAVIAGLALGMLLTYRASGVVNFAHAAVGVFLAYTYQALRTSGELLVPIVGLPGRVHLVPSSCTAVDPVFECSYRFAWGTAFAVTMALAALYGLVLYVAVFRPLRGAPPLARVVATLGLFLYFLALSNLRLGTTGAAVSLPERLLPDRLVSVLGVQIPADRLLLVALVLAATGVLAVVFRRTRFGLATRAAAENERAAVLLGYDPHRLAAVNWMVATMLAGAAVILFAPITTISPGTTSLLFVPALAAALLARFRSFWVTTAAGLAIGMAQSEIQNLHTTVSWLPQINIEQGLPFLIIIVTIAVRGQSLPGRELVGAARFPFAPRPRHEWVWLAVLVVGGSVALFTVGRDLRLGIIVSATSAVLALSVVVITGYVGQISLMPLALAGMSAFSMVKIADAGVPFPIAPLLAALVAVAVGLLAGVPAVRVRGMNLAITTLAAAVALEELVLKWDWFTGGGAGASVAAPSLFGIDLGISAVGDADNRAAFGVLCLVVFGGCAVGVARLRRSPRGLRWLAIRANERAAAAAGVDVAREKLVAFAVSSFIAGLGGCLYAYGHPNLSVNSFVVFQSLALLAMTYLGGIASIGGAVIAGVLADSGVLATLAGREGSQVGFALSGVALVVFAIAYPDGIAGALYRVRDRVVARITPPTSDTPDTPDTPDEPGLAAVRNTARDEAQLPQ
jgi:ABC-type branched-subunit amino acid transport system permease subunit